MRIWKIILGVIGIILGLTVLLYLATFAYFYLQGKSYAVQIPLTQIILQFGKIPSSSFPTSIDASFEKVVTTGGQIARFPKYVDDAIVDSEKNGDLWAHDARTGEKKLYYWQDETAYICVDSRKIGLVNGDTQEQAPDPLTTLENYHFFFNESGLRGDQLLSGLSHFESDVEPGQPVKLLLKSRTKNQDGAYDLVGIFLFVTKECSTYSV